MKKVRLTSGLGVLSASLLLMATATVASAQDETKIEKKVKVFVSSAGEGGFQCEGDDCKHKLHALMNGEGSEGENSHVFVMRTGDGEGLHEIDGNVAHVMIEKMNSGGGEHVWISDDGGKFEFASGGGYLGVQLAELTDALRAHFGVREGSGVMISEVVEGSPAELAGFQAGDVITAVDGAEVASAAALSRAVRKLGDGENAGFEVVRDGGQTTLNATIVEREQPQHLAKVMFAGGGQGMHFGDDANVFFSGCDEDDEDCDVNTMIRKVIKIGSADGLLELQGLDFHSLDCGEGEACEINVNCDDDDCVCTVNGEELDCQDIGHE